MSCFKRYNFTIFICFIFLVSCGEVQEKQKIVLTGYVNSSSMELFDNQIFIAVGSEEDYINKIIAYDLDNHAEKVIYETDGELKRINDLMVNKNYITWVESANDGENAKIILFDRHQNKWKTIYEAAPDMLDLVAPYLMDNNVAWIGMGDGDKPSVVTLYDINKNDYKTISKVNNHNFYNNFIKMHMGSVYWTDMINGENYFVSYDLKTEEVKQIEAKHGTPGYIDVLGENMFALEFTDHFDWVTNVLTYTNTAGNVYEKITDEWVYSFTVFKNNIVYIENQNGNVVKYNLANKQHENIETELEIVETIKASSDAKYLMMNYINQDEEKIEIELIPMN
ncbi:hypothetical protein DX933_15670 [Ornithinibacillus gellani]|uniref:hypothetical protein n=1 Tax=Ornithinibacillus gellani TaxID=2293253 RepID=UPI000F490414|nr:hypothetical protein [Ornithinibacillus gellani]TQS71120.1 hypothetical protein DX933_15670 [Ornithinibacillus gellani]